MILIIGMIYMYILVLSLNAMGLSICHTQKAIHRDIKANNIYLSKANVKGE
jgi:serine/threonine protein kinase